MFDDARSKRVILVAHCVLNQNSISDGTADFPGSDQALVELLLAAKVGIVQLPCPELMCLGLDRGNPDGAVCPLLVENSRIRRAMERRSAGRRLASLARSVVYQILEYRTHGFDVLGMVGINRSPSCGVETTSRNDREVKGRGAFMEALSAELRRSGVRLRMLGVKASERREAIESLRELVLAGAARRAGRRGVVRSSARRPQRTRRRNTQPSAASGMGRSVKPSEKTNP